MKNDASYVACRSAPIPGWHAHLRLGFDREARGTRLFERHHAGPLRVQKPLYPEGRPVCHAVIVHPPGDVVDGDALDIVISACNGAHALLTRPGAGKWYRAHGRPSRQDVRIDLDEEAALEWLPQETLFYRDAQVELTHAVSLGAGETGGCPHTAIREDASISLEAIACMSVDFPQRDLILIESGGDNLAATFSPELSDLTVYVIDVATGEKIPRKGEPGIARSDLLVINKTDLAPLWARTSTSCVRTRRACGDPPVRLHQPAPWCGCRRDRCLHPASGLDAT